MVDTSAGIPSNAATAVIAASSHYQIRASWPVRFLRNFCRADEATAMPLDDPYPTSRASVRCDAAFPCDED